MKLRKYIVPLLLCGLLSSCDLYERIDTEITPLPQTADTVTVTPWEPIPGEPETEVGH